MRKRRLLRKVGWLWLACLIASKVPADDGTSIEPRLEQLLARIDPQHALIDSHGLAFPSASVHISDCQRYPYGSASRTAEHRLASDLARGLTQGLRCLAGSGPAGPLHPYHQRQASKLLDIFEAPGKKTFRCVADRMFANAVASSDKLPPREDALFELLRESGHPAVILDTFRIGGLLSTRHSRKTYRDFFKLDEAQIREHLTGSPLRIDGNHRYRDLPALLFHELVHWLGHEHSAIYPDVAHLYESCCFGGSDYIEDKQLNSAFQARACNILRDDELWGQPGNSYKQMRLWHFKGYDLLKAEMRESYR